MIKIINALVLTSYGYYDNKPRTQSLVDITKAVAKQNPLELHNYETAYAARIKEFLYCAFAGLTASTKWDGTRHVNGGYIDVMKDGQIQYFRAISDDQFTSYLFNNIKLERPQHGSYCKYMIAEAKRHLDEEYTIPDSVVKEKNEKKKGDYGYVYKDAENYDPPAYFLDINYSFRFKR